jgi:hypothetical protein
MVLLFRFQILVPDNYPDGDCPRVVFEGPVFHPHVDPLTHQLNVKQVRVDHRVGRVLSFFSSRRNWDSPTPRPQASVPSPLWLGGRGTLAGERGGGRVPIPTRGHTLWYSLYICTLWCRLSLLGSRVGPGFVEIKV